MTDKRNFYETLYLVRPDIGEAELSAIRGKLAAALKENEAETIMDKKWDERDLAYEVNGYRRGAYHILTYRALPGAPAALEKHLGFHKSEIMRFITVSVDEDQAHGKEPVKPPQPPPRADGEERGRPRDHHRDRGDRERGRPPWHGERDRPPRFDRAVDNRAGDNANRPPSGQGERERPPREERSPWKSARREEKK